MDWTIWVEWGIKSVILILTLLGGFALLIGLLLFALLFWA